MAPLTLAPALFFPEASRAQELNEVLIRAQCEAVHEIEDQSILFGFVVDGRSGTPLPGTTVHLAWTTEEPGGPATNQVSAETRNGAYIFCDVPQDTQLTAWADGMGTQSARSVFTFEGGESTREDIALRFAAAADAGAITGVLLDATDGQPIEAATIRIEDVGASALSDEDGRFRLEEIPPGSYRADVRHLAYGEPSLSVAVTSGLSTHVTIRLDPQAIAVAPIAVEITTRPQWLETNGFYDRVDTKLGQFVTPETILALPGRRFTELLRTVNGLDLRSVCTPHCFFQLRMAGSTVQNCVPTFYMDGRRVHIREEARSRWEPAGLLDLDALAVGADIAAIEVYRSIAETPAEFYGRCGSIVIWTKRGAG